MVVDFSAFKPVSVPIPYSLPTVHEFVAALEPGNLICALDLSDAFYSARLSDEAQQFMDFDASGRVGRYASMPMGHPAAPITLQLLVCIIAEAVSAHGYSLRFYVDDGALNSKSAEEAWAGLLLTVIFVRLAGFRVKLKKVCLPSQAMRYLGMDISTVEKVAVRIPKAKGLSLAAMLEQTWAAARDGHKPPLPLLDTLWGKCNAYAGVSRATMARSAAVLVSLRAVMKDHPSALETVLRPDI